MDLFSEDHGAFLCLRKEMKGLSAPFYNFGYVFEIDGAHDERVDGGHRRPPRQGSAE